VSGLFWTAGTPCLGIRHELAPGLPPLSLRRNRGVTRPASWGRFLGPRLTTSRVRLRSWRGTRLGRLREQRPGAPS
jgi:hypothetical protein